MKLGLHASASLKFTAKVAAKLAAILALVAVFPVLAQAQTTGAAQNISGVAENIISNFGALADLITAAAYVAGFGFAFAAILKFKAHKDNPQQIPVGTPIALLFIAAALIFLPTIFSVSGKTVFGSGGTPGGISGVYSFPTS